MFNLNLLPNPHTDRLVREAASPPRVIRTVPEEKGIFIVEREGGPTSLIRPGLARIGGALIRYTLEKPLDIKDNIPLILVPGFGGIKPAYKELREAIVAEGKTAVTFRPPRHQKKFAGLSPKHAWHPERLLAQAAIAVSEDVIKTDGRQEDYNKVDAAGHSMGGPAVTNAALVKPKTFRSVVLMASAGLDGHTLLDMAVRTPSVLTQEIFPSLNDIHVKKDARSAKHFISYLAENPWRTVAEGLAVGSGDIRDKVSKLGSLGVWSAAQQYAQDRFFPLEGVREKSADLFDLFHVFPNPKAGHLAPQVQPEAVGEDLIYIFSTLEALKTAA